MTLISAAMIARSHSVGEPRWSPSGELVGWLDSWDSRTDLVIAQFDGAAPPMVVTADVAVTSVGAYGGGGWCWISDELVAISAHDGRLVVMRSDGGGIVRELITAGTTCAPAVSPDGAWIACVLEGDAVCDIVVVATDGSTGSVGSVGSSVPVVVSAADYAWDPAWSSDGCSLVWHEWDLREMSWQSSRVACVTRERADSTEWSTPSIVAGSRGIAVGQPRYSYDGQHLAWIGEHDGWWNVQVANADGSQARVLRAEPNDHCSPSWGPGQRSFAWSPDSQSIAYERNENGYGRLVVASLDGAATSDVAKAFHGGLDWNRHGVLAARSGAKTPTSIVVTDAATGTRRVLARGPVAGFEASGLIEPTPVDWPSGDGVAHGVLRRPDGIDAPPMLVMIHGGPTDQAKAEWNPRAAFWVSRGWAVLSVNYRGSSGYGRAYREALNEQWGIADVEDVASGIRIAVASGWCDGERVAVTGGSAGGFTALLVCAMHPALVAAGVSLFGVADLRQLAATTHRFESTYLDALIGPLPEHVDRYTQRSPISLADKITVPMLVLQGRDDKVVPIAQADSMVDAIRVAGANVEYQVYDGEGHGVRKLANVIDELERTEAFLNNAVLDNAVGA